LSRLEVQVVYSRIYLATHTQVAVCPSGEVF